MAAERISDFSFRFSWMEMLPRWIPFHFTDSVPCPWCGWFHETITFGDNVCSDCNKPFTFGVPDCSEDGKLYSYVFPSLKEQQALEKRPSLLGTFTPNERLRAIYFELDSYGLEAGNS